MGILKTEEQKAREILNYDEKKDRKGPKHIDYERKQIYMVFFLMIGIIIGLVIFIMASAPAENKKSQAIDELNKKYLNETISGGEYMQQLEEVHEQYKLDRREADAFIVYYFIIYLFVFFGAIVRMALKQKDYENEQVAYDSFEGPITLDPFDTAQYLLQTDSDSKTEIKTKKDMIRVLERTEVFESIYKSIQGDFEAFKYDKGDIFKKSFEDNLDSMAEALEKAKNRGAKKKRSRYEGLLSGMFKDEDLTIEYIEYKDSMIDKFELTKIFEDAQYEMLESEEVFLYYRPIENIFRLDDVDIDPFSKNDMNQDRLGNINGFLYLLPAEEQDCLDFRQRSSMLEGVKLRKSYISWRFMGMFLNEIPFFIPNSMLEADKQLNEKTTAQAHVKALTFLSHLAIDKDQELRQEIQDLRVDNIDLNTQLDKKRDTQLLKMIHSGELESSWRSRFQMKKISATTAVIGVLALVAGIFIGPVIFG